MTGHPLGAARGIIIALPFGILAWVIIGLLIWRFV